MLKGIFLSLTGLNCLSILLQDYCRHENISRKPRNRPCFVIAQQKTINMCCTQSTPSQKQPKEKCYHMCSIHMAIDQAFSVGIEMHQCQTGTNKATASSHVLSLLVKNEECIETATSPLQNATEDDNTIRQSLL